MRGVDLSRCGRVLEGLDGVMPVGVQAQQVAAQRRPCRLAGQPAADPVRRPVDAFDQRGRAMSAAAVCRASW
jgi:hypothetical protein